MEDGNGGVILSELWDEERFWGTAGLLRSSIGRNARRGTP